MCSVWFEARRAEGVIYDLQLRIYRQYETYTSIHQLLHKDFWECRVGLYMFCEAHVW